MYFDYQKVWSTLTDHEARICKKAIQRKHGGMVRTFIVKAMQRAQSNGMVLADFHKEGRDSEHLTVT